MMKNELDAAGMDIVISAKSDANCERAAVLLDIAEPLPVVDVAKPKWEPTGSDFDKMSVEEQKLVREQLDRRAEAVEGMDYVVTLMPGLRRRVELKSISSFLSRDHGDRLPNLRVDCGTLPFELLNKAGNEWGWLHHFYEPDDVDAVETDDGWQRSVIIKKLDPKARKNASTPSADRLTTYMEPDFLHYLLFKCDGSVKPMAVASISFRWPQLRVRLNEITGGMLSPTWRLNLNKEDIARQPWAEGWIVQGRGMSLCWHVSMEQLADIARVVMLDGQLNKTSLNELERKRLEWLEAHATRRIRL